LLDTFAQRAQNESGPVDETGPLQIRKDEFRSTKHGRSRAMSKKIDIPPDPVNYLRRTMVTVSKRFGKAKAIPIIDAALGEDPLTGRTNLPGEMLPDDAVAAAEKLQAVLDDAPNVVEFPKPATSKPEDFEAPENDRLLALQIVSQFKGIRARSVPDICNRFVWCTGIERWIDRAEPQTQWKASQLDSEYNKFTRRASLSKELQSDNSDPIMRFKRVAFVPGKPEFFGETYNTWRPSAIIPKQGDTSIFDAHVKWLIADDADRNRLLDWMAWVYQHQDQKPNHALLIVGETFGTGKSFLARVMEFLIGTNNVQRPKNSSLSGEFNSWAASCKLAIIEELMQIGRREVEGGLRDLITEPRIEVNTKGVIAYLIDSYLALMAVTNHPDALPLKPGDRRWLVIESPVTLAQKIEKIESGYYARLMPMIGDNPDTEALAAIAYQLKTRKLGKYDARGEAPMTIAKQTMIELGTSPLQTWLGNERQNDPFTRRIVNIGSDIVQLIPSHVMREQSSRAAEQTIAKWLKRELGGIPLGNVRVAGRVVKLWAINGTHVAPSKAAPMYMADKARIGKAEQIEAAEQAAEDFGNAD
jgi:hypothetical protein